MGQASTKTIRRKTRIRWNKFVGSLHVKAPVCEDDDNANIDAPVLNLPVVPEFFATEQRPDKGQESEPQASLSLICQRCIVIHKYLTDDSPVAPPNSEVSDVDEQYESDSPTARAFEFLTVDKSEQRISEILEALFVSVMKRMDLRFHQVTKNKLKIEDRDPVVLGKKRTSESSPTDSLYLSPDDNETSGDDSSDSLDSLAQSMDTSYAQAKLNAEIHTPEAEDDWVIDKDDDSL
jgi:hypothetical protein